MPGPWSVAGLRRLDQLGALDRALVGATIGLVLASAATLSAPAVRVEFVSAGFDLISDTAATLVTLTVSVLAWARYGERRERIALFQSAAFLVLGIANGFSLILVLDQVQDVPSVDLLAPGQTALYISSSARLLSGSLLLLAMSRWADSFTSRHPATILASSAFGLLGLMALIHAVGSALPALSDPFSIGGTGGTGAATLPGSTPIGAAVQLFGGGLYLWGSLIFRRLHQRSGMVFDAYLAVGLLFAAFSQLHASVFPGTYPGLVTSGDLLRVAFDVVLLLGIEAETRSTLNALRLANRRLEQLKDAEADKAALEERTRLSRELHDGLAQDLWLAKLKAARLVSVAELMPEARALSDELGGLIEAGLADARQAVLALRLAENRSDLALTELVRRYVDDFAERFGLRISFECQSEVPRLGHRPEAEVLRIVQEALTNVRRHADATVVKVQMTMDAGCLELTVRDNGRGFEAVDFDEGGYGLASMRERAALIHGQLTVESRPSEGTRVTLVVPLPAPAAPAAATR